jgi:transcriptional regulator with XRE-family HTH domain
MRTNAVAERFTDNLLRARGSAGLTQEEIAFRAGLHRTEVGLLERGLRVPRIDTLVKLAGALGVEPAALLDGIAWNPGDYLPGGFVQKTSAVDGGDAARRAGTAAK